jgi:hypothetical protein
VFSLFLQFFRCTVTAVGVAFFQEFRSVAAVDLLALGLPVGPEITRPAGTFVPVERQPMEIFQDGFLGLRGGPFRVRVFQTEDEGAAHFAGEKKIEEGCTSVAHVQQSRGAGSETNADGSFHRLMP